MSSRPGATTHRTLRPARRDDAARWRVLLRRHALLLLLLPGVLVLAIVYVIPLSQIFLISLRDPAWSITHYLRIFNDPTSLIVLGRTIRLAVEVTVLCLLLGYPVAYLMLRSSERVRRILVLLVISTLWTSALVRSYAWMVILGRQGLVNEASQWLGLTDAPMALLYNRFSVYVGMVHIMLPFMILPLYSVMQRIDRRLLTAARSLGAGPIAGFVLVFFPLSIPGVFAGSLLVAILSLGFFVTPALLGGLKDITYVMLIERYVNLLFRFELASAMSVVLLVVTVVLVVVYQRILAAGPVNVGSTRAGTGPRWLLTGSVLVVAWLKRRARASSAPAAPRRGWRFSLRAGDVLGWSVVFFLVAPVTIIFPLSFSSAAFLQFPPPGFSLRWFENYFSREDWITPTLTSFKVASVTMVVATLIGLLAAIPIVRGNFPGKRILLGFLLSPMIVPTIVLAVAYYFFFAQYKLIGTMTALILAHLVLALPYVVVVISSALQATGESLERAARTLGANPFRAFNRVTLPLIRPAVFTAALFAFLASFDELVIAIFVSGVAAKTLPKRMWDGIREEIDPTTAAVAAILTVLSLALLFAAELVRARAQKSRGGGVNLGGLLR